MSFMMIYTRSLSEIYCIFQSIKTGLEKVINPFNALCN